MNSTTIFILIIFVLIIACVAMFWPKKKGELESSYLDQASPSKLDLSNISDSDFKKSLLETNYSMNKRLVSINKLLGIFIFILILSIFASGIYYILL